jgi:hypothetical protein
MKSLLQPWQLLLLFLAGWINRRQQEVISHYHAERDHQGLGNRIIEPGNQVSCTAGEITCREQLGGMLRYYHRRAA